MLHIFDIEKLVWAGWFTPTQMTEFYHGAIEALHAPTSAFEALGSPTLLTGVAVLLSVPLIWAAARWNRG